MTDTLAAGIYEFLGPLLTVGTRSGRKEVHPLTLPQGVVLPAVTYQVVSDDTELTHQDAQDHPLHDGVRYERTRVQFTCYGRTYDEAEALRNQLRAVTVGFRGLWGDHPVRMVRPSIALDDYDPATRRWRCLQDMEVDHLNDANAGS